MIREEKQLTPHFSLFELTRTSRDEFKNENRDLTDEQVYKLTDLARFLEFIRMICGDYPLFVHNGYRCFGLNNAVGGVPNSQHLLCEAVDFHVKELTVESVYNKIAYNAPFLVFGQLIWEVRKDSEWIHLSMRGNRPPELCQQVFKNMIL